MTLISIDGYEPAQVAELARKIWPDKSDAWLAVWLQRLAWYVEHNGDTAGAPEFPEDE